MFTKFTKDMVCLPCNPARKVIHSTEKIRWFWAVEHESTAPGNILRGTWDPLFFHI